MVVIHPERVGLAQPVEPPEIKEATFEVTHLAALCTNRMVVVLIAQAAKDISVARCAARFKVDALKQLQVNQEVDCPEYRRTAHRWHRFEGINQIGCREGAALSCYTFQHSLARSSNAVARFDKLLLDVPQNRFRLFIETRYH